MITTAVRVRPQLTRAEMIRKATTAAPPLTAEQKEIIARLVAPVEVAR